MNLDKFNFEYSFKSSSSLYKRGLFNSTLQLILENYHGIMDIILPTLGKERQKTPLSKEMELPLLFIHSHASQVIIFYCRLLLWKSYYITPREKDVPAKRHFSPSFGHQKYLLQQIQYRCAQHSAD